jgi:hypothetical protein
MDRLLKKEEPHRAVGPKFAYLKILVQNCSFFFLESIYVGYLFISRLSPHQLIFICLSPNRLFEP